MRRLNSWSCLVLVLAVAFAIVLFAMVPEAHAQEGNPPPTQEPEIVGGAPSTAGEWPWQVAIIDGAAVAPFRDDQFCGGSLIHPEWVLTAAHCITNESGGVVAASSLDAVAGIYNLSSPAAGYQRRDVTQIVRHPSYNDSTTDNDIALLHLSSAVTIGGSGETAIAIVPLVPAAVGTLAGTNSWVTGWGNMNWSSPTYPDQLYEVQVPIITNSVCNDSNHYPGGITANMMCAGYDAGGLDACQGDSGGPLVVYHSGQWKLAGIVSWGGECAAPYQPGVYTRVSQYGTWVNQTIGLGTTLVSPSGAIGTNYTPTYTWNAVSIMTYYYLYVNGPSGNVIKQWYSAADAGCAGGTGTCSVTPTTPLGGGNHKWWVQTWNEAGYGPWSAEMTFSTTIPIPPAATTLSAPTGAVTDTTPTYTWNAVSNSTWYYLYVNGPSGNIIKQWYSAAEAGCAGGTGTCSVTPLTELGGGLHTWWVQTYNSAGYGPWSSSMTFTLPVPTIPGAATLTAPSGSISTSTPTYTWSDVTESTAESAATWYYLYVNGPSGNVIKQWYQASAICDSGTCSATPTTALGGSHTWWVQTYNSAGYGPWSSGMTFSTPTPWPNAPTLISPNGSTTDLTPVYSWNVVSSETGVPASWYQVSVTGPSGNVFSQWFDAAVVCSGGTCSAAASPAKTLVPGGMYTFWVRGWNAAGNGPWSDGMSFTLASTGGFNSQFNGSSIGWSQSGGTWSIASSQWYTTMGQQDYSNSSYYSFTYTNFDYSARFYRAGCVWCDNFLYVRGSPSPDAVGYWNSGYEFTYANDGYFAVWKVVGGDWTLLQDYTYTSAIAQGGWNTLRVVASDSNLYFYINGTLVWTGSDSSLTSGYVGLGMDNFQDTISSGDQVWVDWAVLNSYAEDLPVITDTVSPEQQALNDAANAGGSDKTDGGNHQR